MHDVISKVLKILGVIIVILVLFYALCFGVMYVKYRKWMKAGGAHRTTTETTLSGEVLS